METKSHIMIDLETLGTEPTSAIVSIGAYIFSGFGKGRGFYSVVDASEYSDLFTQNIKTLEWWEDQSDEVRAVLTDPNKVPIVHALQGFSEFFDDLPEAIVWGNGAAFDLAILNNAYAQLSLEVPWKFWNERCYRTVKALIPEPIERIGAAHNALDDAKTQGEHLAKYGQQFLK